MVAVRINGEESNITGEGLPKVADLVELIKVSIDPDHMITGILLNGRELEEQDWFAPVAQMGTAIFEVETDTLRSFLADRLSKAGDVVKSCYMEFRDSRKCFQNGDMSEGNQRLMTAVNTLRAFFEWYGTLMELMSEEERSSFDISNDVEQLVEVCKRITQQQLYQSWWALGETLERELEPKLDGLEDSCRRFRQEMLTGQ